MLQAFGDRVIALGRELTKAHEKLVIQPISAHLSRNLEERGEFTVVVSGASEPLRGEDPTPSPPQLLAEIGHLIDKQPLSRREAIRTLAKRHGLSNREVFRLLEEAKKIGHLE